MATAAFPRDRSRPVPPGLVGRPAPRARWGWLEAVVLAQVILPALIFLPSLGPLRLVQRVACFVISLVAGAYVLAAGRRNRMARGFPASPWLAGCAIWLALSVGHPTTNSLLSGLAAAVLNISILLPALWVPASIDSPVRARRLILLLLAFSFASTLLGIAQFYYPTRFDPPSMLLLDTHDEGLRGQLSVRTSDGQTILRPCGLTDSPGGAGGAGVVTCLVATAWGLRARSRWRALVCFGAATAGLIVVYLCQVRLMLVLALLNLVVIAALLAVKRDYAKLTRLAVAGALILVGSVALAVRLGGDLIFERFQTLVSDGFGNAYYSNRGFFLEALFDRYIYEWPLGAGLGRWGMVYYYFGDHTPSATRGGIYSEIQLSAWLMDGGIPLILGYVIALAAAMWNTARIALTCPDREVAFDAIIVFAYGMGVLAATFSAMPFIGPSGLMFWAIFGALHGSEQWVRARPATAPA